METAGQEPSQSIDRRAWPAMGRKPKHVDGDPRGPQGGKEISPPAEDGQLNSHPAGRQEGEEGSKELLGASNVHVLDDVQDPTVGSAVY